MHKDPSTFTLTLNEINFFCWRVLFFHKNSRTWNCVLMWNLNTRLSLCARSAILLFIIKRIHWVRSGAWRLTGTCCVLRSGLPSLSLKADGVATGHEFYLFLMEDPLWMSHACKTWSPWKSFNDFAGDSFQPDFSTIILNGWRVPLFIEWCFNICITQMPWVGVGIFVTNWLIKAKIKSFLRPGYLPN